MLMIGATLGVALAYFVWLDVSWLVLAILVLFLIAIMILTKRTVLPLIICVLAGLLLGWRYATPVRQQLQVYDNLIGKEVVLSGVLFDDVAKTASGAHIFRLDQVEIQGRKLPGDVLVMSRQSSLAKRGDRLEVSGKLSEGLAGYRATFKNAQLGQVTANHDLGLKMRNFFTDNLDRQLSPLQSSLASAF